LALIFFLENFIVTATNADNDDYLVTQLDNSEEYKSNLRLLYLVLTIKIVFFAPFIALEYFDLIFQHLYVDFIILENPIAPPSRSPRRRP
jgi:hypothetical protein